MRWKESRKHSPALSSPFPLLGSHTECSLSPLSPVGAGGRAPGAAGASGLHPPHTLATPVAACPLHPRTSLRPQLVDLAFLPSSRTSWKGAPWGSDLCSHWSSAYHPHSEKIRTEPQGPVQIRCPQGCRALSAAGELQL